MQYRPLGSTGERVSILGFGCMRLPVINGRESDIDEPLAEELVHTAVARGVNYLDTAYPYHDKASEPFLGRVLEKGLRDKVLLATKLPPWEVSDSRDFDRLLNEQLERLRTDRIDCYLLHALKKEWWDRLKELGVLDFLDRAVRDGRIRFPGFSFHDELEPFKEIVEAYDWSLCQIQYNFMDESMQAGREGLELAASKGIGVVVMEPLRGGALARQAPEDIQAVWDRAAVSRSPAEWALRWVWDQPEVSVVLSGMNTPEQLEENCRIAAKALPGSLTAQEHSLIEEVRDRYRERIQVPCTACGYCMPCPSGVNIPRILSIYNDRFIYGDKRWSHLMYSFASNAGEQADACIECGECEETCPQGIPIIQELKKVHQTLSQPA